MQALRAYEDRSCRTQGRPNVALWLEFVILTGVRISEARLATWEQIDVKNATWIVPAENHKIGSITGEPHLVPITKPMWAILMEMERRKPDHAPDALIFSSPRTQRGWRGNGSSWRDEGRAFEVNTVARFVRHLEWETEVTPHGFRSTLTDWCRANEYSKDFIDAQVGHIQHGKVAQAYARDQLVNQRRPMMERWGEYCSQLTPEPIEDGNVESLAEQRQKRRTA